MKSLSSIVRENLDTTKPVDEGKFAERRRRWGSAIANRAKKTGKSLSSFAHDVITQDHV